MRPHGKGWVVLVAMLVGMLGRVDASDGATITAASCSTAHVQAAVDTSVDGDIVQIPNGSCAWSSGIETTKQIMIRAQNYTPTAGGTASRNVILTNNATVPLFHFASGANYHVGIVGVRFNEGVGDGNHIRFDGTGSKVPLVADCYFEVQNRFGNQPDIAVIAWLSQGGVMWNTWIEGVGDGLGGQCCPEGASMLVDSPRLWETASTMGSLDTAGAVNTYVEDSTFKNFGQSPDIDDRGRFVMRYSLIDGASGLTHGFTSSKGGRHAEYYNNTFTTTTDNRNLPGRYFWLRAGTILFTDNVVNTQNQGYGTPVLLDVGDTTSPTAYPQARQPGWGHDGANSVIDPIYIWNNTGAGAYVVDIDAAWATNVQLDRDIFVNNGAKPSYVKYTYPHPAREALAGSSFIGSPTNLTITASTTVTFLAAPSGVGVTANAVVPLGNPSGVTIGATDTPAFPTSPTGAGLTAAGTPAFPGTPSSVVITIP